ncbi:MAG: nitroreductase family protein [Faecousia sp.]
MLGKMKKYLSENTTYGKTRYLNFLYQYDMRRYYQHSCMNENNINCLATKIRLLSHTIEKALSLPSCKPGFGKEKIRELIALCERYEKTEPMKDEQALIIARAVITEYIRYQEDHNVGVDFIPEKYRQGGVESDCKAGICLVLAKKSTDFERIARGRHSSRSFSDRHVSHETIQKAVALAQTAPSACNRQSTRIFACLNKKAISEIMKLHGGTRGFDTPPIVFAVTGDLNLYQNEYERNTIFVDGGIFLMNLLYSLESVGLVACPLIWGAEPTNDNTLYQLLNIPESQTVVALVAAGYAPEKGFAAAVSYKRETKDILTIVE